jgi:SAM-dependent methyltransferase
MDMTPYSAACDAAAGRLGVAPGIHPDDFIFHFLINNPVFSEPRQAVDYYFENGADSAQKLRDLLTGVCGRSLAGLRLLDFASGYGCVARHYRNLIPECAVTTCDIHPQAVAFLQQDLEVPAVTSASQPEQLTLPGLYDAVFALSFFSHMPRSSFTRWLARLTRALAPGGHLIFTTHGLVSQARHLAHAVLDEENFYFAPDSEQQDLSEAEYGTTISGPDFVVRQLFTIPRATLVYFREAAWWGHQDVYIVRLREAA